MWYRGLHESCLHFQVFWGDFGTFRGELERGHNDPRQIHKLRKRIAMEQVFRSWESTRRKEKSTRSKRNTLGVDSSSKQHILPLGRVEVEVEAAHFAYASGRARSHHFLPTFLVEVDGCRSRSRSTSGPFCWNAAFCLDGFASCLKADLGFHFSLSWLWALPTLSSIFFPFSRSSLVYCLVHFGDWRLQLWSLDDCSYHFLFQDLV